MNPYFGSGRPCFVIAEIGANHDGDIDACLQTMDAAKAAGVDAIKLQYYTASELVADVDRVWEWGPPGRRTKERVGDMFDRLGLSADEMARAYAHAAALEIPLFCTPFSPEGVATLIDLGNPIWKIASSDIAYYPMLDAIAATRKPTIVSTGKCPMRDVEDALERLAAIPDEDLAVLHCIAQYPAPYDEMNVRVIETLGERFPGHPIGLSDHCPEDEPALAAVALGASVLEKHFTLDRDRDGPDHWFSLDPEQFGSLVTRVRRVEASLGDGAKGVAKCEEWERAHSTRSIVARRDIAEGAVISDADLALLRPGTGLHPRLWAEVVGATAVRAIAAGTPITDDQLN